MNSIEYWSSLTDDERDSIMISSMTCKSLMIPNPPLEEEVVILREKNRLLMAEMKQAIAALDAIVWARPLGAKSLNVLCTKEVEQIAARARNRLQVIIEENTE